MNVQTAGPWAESIEKGTSKAMKNLSQMLNQPIEVSSFGLRSIPIADISHSSAAPK